MSTADEAVADAISNNDVAALREALGRGGNPTYCEENFRPLHFAIMLQMFDIAKVLIDAGSDVNRTDDNGYTPLHYAVEAVADFLRGLKYETRFSPDLVRKLIEAGADINAITLFDMTPLDVAILEGHEVAAAFIATAGGKRASELSDA